MLDLARLTRLLCRRRTLELLGLMVVGTGLAVALGGTAALLSFLLGFPAALVAVWRFWPSDDAHDPARDALTGPA